jgi:hypothetical protein
MQKGMMWFDNDPGTALTAKVQRAAEYYLRKYGIRPDTCLVNPAMLGDKSLKAGAVSVRASKTVLPGHLWIGVTEKLPVAAD